MAVIFVYLLDLQPDITAPGVNILASFPSSDESRFSAVYGMDSGTSMACPHASGVAATIKAINRNWSPAAIKSALMTTGFVQEIFFFTLFSSFIPTFLCLFISYLIILEQLSLKIILEVIFNLWEVMQHLWTLDLDI